MFYTIVPLEYIFEEECENDGQNKHEKEEIEIRKEGLSLMAQSIAPGEYKITRIISTNANDYLRPEWQPGVTVSSKLF
jgi:hypothetical protein